MTLSLLTIYNISPEVGVQRVQRHPGKIVQTEREQTPIQVQPLSC